MFRLAVSATAFALIGGVAAAADLPPPMAPAPEPTPIYSPTPMAYNWSGFYVGAHGGWGFGNGAFDDGFVIGGQIGVNWQWDNFVLGAEGDGSFVDWNGADAVGTARLRGGLAIGRFLAYATGGAAFQDFDDVGWTVGGGGEYALTDNVSVGVEYLHYDFDNDDSDVIRGRVNVKFNSLFGG